MKRTLFMALLLLTMIGLFAANQTLASAKSSPTANEAMLTASQLYEAGQFDQAAQAYQQLADQGYADSALFYNLGNAYYKQGEIGRAILNYRRAQALAPRDLDIQANLAFVRAQTVDQFDIPNDEGFLLHLMQSAAEWLNPNEVALVTLGTWFLSTLLLMAFSSSPRDSVWRIGLRYALTAVFIVLVLGVFALGSHVYLEQDRTDGVVVATDVAVTSGPGSQYLTEFTLHSGTEVSLADTRGSWVRVVLPGADLQGWVPASAVEAVATQPGL